MYCNAKCAYMYVRSHAIIVTVHTMGIHTYVHVYMSSFCCLYFGILFMSV